MTPDPPSSGLESVAASAAEAQLAPDLRAGAEAEGGGDSYDVAELGPDCPVTALGSQDKICWYLDYRGGVFDLSTRCEKGEFLMLYGTRMAWLDKAWPQWKKVGEEKTGEVDDNGKPVMRAIYEQNGFNQADAQRAHILACAKLPYFDPKNKVRGRGAHLGPNGELVLHCGDELLVGGRKGVKGQPIRTAAYKVGMHAGFVYARGEALARPAAEPAPVNIAMEVLRLLETWRWKRKEVDAYLMLCWLACAFVGGALRVRPHGWIVGPSGAGKTTLQEFIRNLMGDWGIETEDGSAAGVRQLLDKDTLAILFDEIEAEAENQDVVMAIVRLARLAYSGASAVRGSTDHKAKQFVARSCFLFSSIHHHELPAQDRNRIAILGLGKFPPKTEKFVLPATARQWGDALRRRMVEQWGRYSATLDRYQRAMLELGYSGREQDTYGTLLACGDLLLHEAAPPSIEQIEARGAIDRVADKVRELAGVLETVRSESIDTSERCIKHLASTLLPAAGGQHQETVRRWIIKSLMTIATVKIQAGRSRIRNVARDKLGEHGMRLVHLAQTHLNGNGQGGLIEAYMAEEMAEQPGELVMDIWVAIANQTNAGIKAIFAKSAWASGNWNQPLALIPGGFVNKKTRFGGGDPEGCVLVPLEAVIDIADAMQQARDAALDAERQPELPGGVAEERG